MVGSDHSKLKTNLHATCILRIEVDDCFAMVGLFDFVRWSKTRNNWRRLAVEGVEIAHNKPLIVFEPLCDGH